MAINNETLRVVYDCDGVATEFPITISYLQDEDLRVVHYDDDAGAEYTLALGVGYTVSGGNVVTAETLPVGDKILIGRDISLVQPIDLTAGDDMDPETIETGFDRLTLMTQQVVDSTNRSVRIANTDPDADLYLPQKTVRQNSFLHFDEDGNPEAHIGPVPRVWDAYYSFSENDLTQHAGELWRSKTDDNMGNALPSVDEGENTYWILKKTGGSSEIDGQLGEAASLGNVMYFDSATGKLKLADNRYLARCFVAGLLTKTGVLDDFRSCMKGGKLVGLSGLTGGENYFLGHDGALVPQGSIGGQEYLIYIGTAISTTEIDINIQQLNLADRVKGGEGPLGVISDYTGTIPPLGWEWVPMETTTKLKSLYQQYWETVLGEKDWFAPDAAAASAADTAGTFHFPTLKDLYVRSGFHADATFDNTDNSVTLIDKNGTTINDDWKNGTPIRFIGGTMPTGITEFTTYYLGWDAVDAWNIYDTQANAEVNDGSTGLVAITDNGTGVTGTQFGIILEDQMQGHDFYLFKSGNTSSGLAAYETAYVQGGSGSGSLTEYLLRGALVQADTGKTNGGITSDGTNGTPRTGAETRPRTSFARKIIKVSNLLPSGEPVTAVKYDTGWTGVALPASPAVITHNLNVDYEDIIIQLYTIESGNEREVHDFEVGENSADPTNKIEIVHAITSTNYRVVIYKPTILSSVVELMYPIGAQYTQYASVASNDASVALPSTEAPAALFGGVWEKLWDTESMAFRTEGTDADDGRTDGKQLDQMQGHWHKLYNQSSVVADGGHTGIRNGSSTDATSETTANNDEYVRDAKSDGTNGTPRTGSETRVTNRLMRIWRRTA